MKAVSELRQDIVSGDWVVIATGRAKRPHDYSKEKKLLFRQAKTVCPFETLHPEALLFYSADGQVQKKPGSAKAEWAVQVVSNKYPAFSKGKCPLPAKRGVYEWMEGIGYHEVVITRDHEKGFAQIPDQEVELTIRAFQDRFLALRRADCVRYISVFQNYGRSAGATISHPHSQIIATPVVPLDVGRSLRGSARFYHKNNSCIHCLMLKYELKSRERIIYENENFVALTPFASKTAFEVRIFPKKHKDRFEEIQPDERLILADALRISLAKLHQGLKNPDYNFFIHTAPVKDSKEFEHYHWHFEILPKTAIWAGFEISTGIEISTIAPENAAEFLRKIKV